MLIPARRWSLADYKRRWRRLHTAIRTLASQQAAVRSPTLA